jgi:hypothetical protein
MSTKHERERERNKTGRGGDDNRGFILGTKLS